MQRQVEIAEEQAQQLARMVTAIVRDLGHDPADQRVRQIVRFRLGEAAREAGS